MISARQLFIKRLFDLCLSLILIPVLLIPIVILVVIATIDTGLFGWFQQERIGQDAKPFMMYKIRTLRGTAHQLGDFDSSATWFGQFLRTRKLDELPQLFNVLFGQMSFVGPRPDVRGFADQLQGDDRLLLRLKPGITGPATLKYRDEDKLLAVQDDPETYNRTIIWPDKVKMNVNYIRNWSFSLDLNYLIQSILN